MQQGQRSRSADSAQGLNNGLRRVCRSGEHLEHADLAALYPDTVRKGAVQFKGSGWYVTDYAKGGAQPGSSTGESSSKDGKAKSEKAADDKSDAKKSGKAETSKAESSKPESSTKRKAEKK